MLLLLIFFPKDEVLIDLEKGNTRGSIQSSMYKKLLLNNLKHNLETLRINLIANWNYIVVKSSKIDINIFEKNCDVMIATEAFKNNSSKITFSSLKVYNKNYKKTPMKFENLHAYKKYLPRPRSCKKYKSNKQYLDLM